MLCACINIVNDNNDSVKSCGYSGVKHPAG